MDDEDDGWNDEQEAAFQQQKQLAYEVRAASISVRD